MDQVVAQALTLYRKLAGEKRLDVKKGSYGSSVVDLSAAGAVNGNGKHG
jgi:hypothetical protein